MANDPWKSYRGSRDTLLQSMDTKVERDRQAEKDAIYNRYMGQQFDLGEIKLGQLRQDVADQSALRDLETTLAAGKTVEVPNPALEGQAYKPGAGPLRPTVEQNVPLSPLEMMERRAQARMAQGDVAGAGQVVDVSTKIRGTQAEQKAIDFISSYQTMGMPGVAAMLRANGQDPSVLNSIQFDPDGVGYTQDLGENGILHVRMAGGQLKAELKGRASVSGADQWSEPYPAMVGGKEVLLRKNLTTGKVEQVSTGPSGTGSGVHGVDTGDIEGMADAVEAGRLNISSVPARGAIRAQVVATLERRRKATGQGPVDYVATEGDNKALVSSIGNLQKRRNMAGTFVRNMDKQLAQFKDLTEKVRYTNPAALNYPWQKFQTFVQGNGELAAYRALVTDLSNEAAKLSSGAEASVAALTEGQSDKWAGIHYEAMPTSEMLQLLDETVRIGKQRVQSFDDELAEVRGALRDRPDSKKETEGVKTVKTDADYEALPSGAVFIDPDGVKRRKP